MTIRTALLAGCLYLAWACGDGGSGVDSGKPNSGADSGASSDSAIGSDVDAGKVTPFDDPEEAARELCEEHARLSCERELACGLLPGTELVADCEQRKLEQCAGRPPSYVYTFALVGTRLRYDPSLAPDCTQPPRDCVQRHWSPNCYARFIGIAEPNSRCTQTGQDIECLHNYHCWLDSYCEGTCRRDIGPGGECQRLGGSEAEPCEEGLRCLEGTCVEAPDEGEPCDRVRCADGLTCNDDYHCETTPPPPGMGELCLRYDCEDGGMSCPPSAEDCAAELVCSHGVCTDAPTRAAAGESCKTWSDCKRGLRCVGVMDAERECREPAPEGTPCLETLECEEGSTCSEGQCRPIPAVPLGEACDESFRCNDEVGTRGCCETGADCEDGVCVPYWRLQEPTALGDPCDVNRDNCELFTYCNPDSGLCEEAKLPGDECSFDEECAWNGFGRCGNDSGRCEEYPDTCRDREFLE